MNGSTLSTGFSRWGRSLYLILNGNRRKQLVIVRILLECIHDRIYRIVTINDSKGMISLNFLSIVQFLIDQVGKNRLILKPGNITIQGAFDTSVNSAPWGDRM